MFGSFPDGVRVRIEGVADAEVRALLAGMDVETAFDEIAAAPPGHPLLWTECWPAANVTWEHSPGLRVGFTMDRTPPPAVAELRAVLAAGTSPFEFLAAKWEDLRDDDRAPICRELVAWAALANDTDRDAFVDWLDGRSMTHEAVKGLLASWPAWVQARAHRVVDIACRPVGAWLPEDRGLVERRVTEGGAWGAWAAYLVANHLHDGAITGVGEALWRGATLPGALIDDLAAAVTSWSKDLLGDACRAMARGGPAVQSRWRIALVRRVKGDDPRWAEINAAMADPLPMVIPSERPFD
jgi:hypothetical protein